jgi:exosortase
MGSMRAARLAVVLVLGFVAYRPLFLVPLHIPSYYEISGWFFRPDQPAPLLAVGLCGWLLWRRRTRSSSLPAGGSWIGGSRVGGSRMMAAALLALGASFFVWGHLADATNLLLLSLASNLLAVAASSRGLAGCRAVLLPAAVLLLGIQIPDPLNNELVWHLQLATANSAAWLMGALGMDIARHGVMLERGEHTFMVIEACCGLRGIQILLIAAVAIRDLFASSGARQWLLILLAPGIGYVLNLVRVVFIVASGDPASVASNLGHIVQGVLVLGVGTAILHELGWAMATVGARHATAVETLHAPPPPVRWGPTAALLAVLAVISFSVPPFSSAEAWTRVEFPSQRAGWSGEDLEADVQFLGAMPSLYRRYQKESSDGAPRVVELFVGLERAGNPLASRVFSSKLAIPDRDWSLQESGPARLRTLDLDADVAIMSRGFGSDHAVVYSWWLRDDGLWWEALRSFLALDSGPFRRARPRAVVRLLTPLERDGAGARERAEQTLDRFITEFRGDLTGL